MARCLQWGQSEWSRYSTNMTSSAAACRGQYMYDSHIDGKFSYYGYGIDYELYWLSTFQRRASTVCDTMQLCRGLCRKKDTGDKGSFTLSFEAEQRGGPWFRFAHICVFFGNIGFVISSLFTIISETYSSIGDVSVDWLAFFNVSKFFRAGSSELVLPSWFFASASYIVTLLADSKPHWMGEQQSLNYTLSKARNLVNGHIACRFRTLKRKYLWAWLLLVESF